MRRSLRTLVPGIVILAALMQTSSAKEEPHKTVRFACVVFDKEGHRTELEGDISHPQFIKWFKKDYRVGGERVETPAEATAFGVLALTDGEEILVMPLYKWGKGNRKLFSCQSIAIGKAPMFNVVAESQKELLSTMKSRFGELSMTSEKPRRGKKTTRAAGPCRIGVYENTSY